MENYTVWLAAWDSYINILPNSLITLMKEEAKKKQTVINEEKKLASKGGKKGKAMDVGKITPPGKPFPPLDPMRVKINRQMLRMTLVLM
jgi:hypothetical protein